MLLVNEIIMCFVFWLCECIEEIGFDSYVFSNLYSEDYIWFATEPISTVLEYTYLLK